MCTSQPIESHSCSTRRCTSLLQRAGEQGVTLVDLCARLHCTLKTITRPTTWKPMLERLGLHTERHQQGRVIHTLLKASPEDLQCFRQQHPPDDDCLDQ